MDNVEIIVIGACALHLLSIYNYLEVIKKKVDKRHNRRRWWMIACHRNRTVQSMETMFLEMVQEDSGEFENFCRMSQTDFFYLLEQIEPLIKKKDTKWRPAIPAKVRLAVALRYLATGDSFRSLHYVFKISSSTISEIIIDVCQALNTILKDEIKMPQTPGQWMEIEKGFATKFPHCIGAIDGKHITLQCPIASASQFYNYKRTFSIVLLALVDSKYNIIYADIGAPGRISDGGVFKNSLLYQKMNSGDLYLPPPSPLPGRHQSIPYVFLGDGAFALNTNVMKPFPGHHADGSLQRIFNYRLSSARVIVENVFGVLASVFRIFRKPMELQPEKAKNVTMTCILLHNFLRRRETSRNIYTPPGTFDTILNGEVIQEGSWRRFGTSSILRPLRNIARRAPLTALEIRNEFAEYFYTT